MLNPLYLETAVVCLGLILLLVEAFAGELDRRIFAWAAVAGLGAVFVATFFAGMPSDAAPWQKFYALDSAALFFKRFALVTTIIVLVISVEYLGVVSRFISSAHHGAGLGEFIALPLFTCAGLMWMASAVDFVMVFVSLELVTISFYVLVTYTRRRADSLEAGVKYLILGALSTGFFVYGVTWVFGLTGETNLAAVTRVLPTLKGADSAMLFSFALLMIALGFKIAAAPFQLWVPDVYQGAPTPVTAFLSVGSKAAGFIVLLRVLDVFLTVPALVNRIGVILIAMAAATLLYGNLAALPQTNLKRLLAYSSIAHAGYLLIAVVSVLPRAASTAPPVSAGDSIAFYLAGYLLMTLLSFAVMVLVSNHTGGDDISHFNGLAKRAPKLAFAMLIAMLSLAGIPFTVGFFAKFFIFAAAYADGQWLLLTIGVLSVACGFYYYLKVVRAMYFQPSAAGAAERINLSIPTGLTVAVLAGLILLLGIYPQPALTLFKSTARPAVAASR